MNTPAVFNINGLNDIDVIPYAGFNVSFTVKNVLYDKMIFYP